MRGACEGGCEGQVRCCGEEEGKDHCSEGRARSHRSRRVIIKFMGLETGVGFWMRENCGSRTSVIVVGLTRLGVRQNTCKQSRRKTFEGRSE